MGEFTLVVHPHSHYIIINLCESLYRKILLDSQQEARKTVEKVNAYRALKE